MHGTQKRYLGMFRRVHELLAVEPLDPTIALPLKELEGIVGRMSDHGVTQDTLQRRARSSTVQLHDAARALRRDLLRPALLAARTIYPSLGNGALALRTVLRMPRSASDFEALVVGARAFANAVEEHADAFAAAGLPPNLPTRLRAAADDLVQRIGGRAAEAQRGMAATRGLALESQRGAAIVRLLDSLVEPALRRDPVRFAEWRMATRIRSFASGAGAPETPVTPVITPAPASGAPPVATPTPAGSAAPPVVTPVVAQAA
jgi:hypothetical protein